MRSRSLKKVERRWPAPDRWEVILSALGLLVAIGALVEQVGR